MKLFLQVVLLFNFFLATADASCIFSHEGQTSTAVLGCDGQAVDTASESELETDLMPLEPLPFHDCQHQNCDCTAHCHLPAFQIHSVSPGFGSFGRIECLVSFSVPRFASQFLPSALYRPPIFS